MRITTGTMAIGLVAILVGLVAAYGVRSALKSEPPAPRPRPPRTTNVPLASLDLPENRVIAMGDISLVPMTAEQMRERQMPLQLTMLSPEQIIGRRLREPINQGEPFLTTAMYPQGTGPMSPKVYEKLKPGFRAVTLPLPVEQTAAVTEGALVDVMFRAERPEMLVTLVEGAEVLKIDRPAGRNVPYTVTLGVSYENARKLQVVNGRGDISFVARSPGDVSPLRSEPLTLAQVLQLPTPERETPFQTEVFVGGRRVVNKFSPQLLPQAEAPDGEFVRDIFDRSDLRAPAQEPQIPAEDASEPPMPGSEDAGQHDEPEADADSDDPLPKTQSE